MILSLNYLKILQATVLIILILYFGQTLFVPLAYALFISFIIYPWCKWMESKGISKSFSILLSLSAVLIVLGSIVALFVVQFIEFTKQWPLIQNKVIELITNLEVYVNGILPIGSSNQKNWMDNIIDSSSSELIPFVKNTIYVSSVSSILILLIPVYVSLILYYRKNLLYFLYHLFAEGQKENINEILHESILTYANFIKGLMVVYLIVGSLNSFGLYILGIPNPIFFGFVASILTIIPYVGIAIGALLPICVAWITYDSAWYPLGVIGIFTIVQILEANIIFPLAVSRGLKLNTLITLIVIVAGGLIWGVSGMILFIPFVAILKLISDKLPNLKPLSVVLGTDNIK